jgi:hypothetical protein
MRCRCASNRSDRSCSDIVVMAETLSTRKQPVIKNAAAYFGRVMNPTEELTHDGDDLSWTISVLAQQFCRSRRAPGRGAGSYENAALFSIHWPRRNFEKCLSCVFCYSVSLRGCFVSCGFLRICVGVLRDVTVLDRGRGLPSLPVRRTSP